eukprot:TRINITY_DN1653_c8_g1_i1.p1 TRINITY_DN1653_c8_g1~~TRINITY_DN1653_c8_g1_i1.p1  ORF type:complete len:148 (+),score=13.10 TRINITY_DN1653_c8_g1_i1:41-445(+)
MQTEAASVPMLGQQPSRCSFRDLRRNKVELKKLSKVYEDISTAGGGQTRGGKAAPCCATSDELRRLQWTQLGPTLKIQRWVRRHQSRQNVKKLLAQRHDRHAVIWQTSAAETIQAAWKSYQIREEFKKQRINFL